MTEAGTGFACHHLILASSCSCSLTLTLWKAY